MSLLHRYIKLVRQVLLQRLNEFERAAHHLFHEAHHFVPTPPHLR